LFNAARGAEGRTLGAKRLIASAATFTEAGRVTSAAPRRVPETAAEAARARNPRRATASLSCSGGAAPRASVAGIIASARVWTTTAGARQRVVFQQVEGLPAAAPGYAERTKGRRERNSAG